jgi:hypothetical protein
MANIEEVLKGSKILVDILENTGSTGAKIRSAGRALAVVVEDVPDKESAAIALYTVGKLISEIALDGTPDDKYDQVSGVMTSYGMSLAYAAYTLLQK